MHVVAMIHQEGEAFGVSFPDFPGCTTVANDLESAIAKAAEVLAFHAEGLAEDGTLPRARSLTELNEDRDFLEDRTDALLVLVPYEPPSRAVRINVTIEESLLSRIDHAAEAAGETRSRYLATSARLRMGGSSEEVLTSTNGPGEELAAGEASNRDFQDSGGRISAAKTLDQRRGDKVGKIEQKHGSTKIGMLRKQYGDSFAAGRRSDMTLRTLLKETGSISLNDYLRRRHK
jgi:predicted RNase H-like HicB family nuclease